MLSHRHSANSPLRVEVPDWGVLSARTGLGNPHAVTREGDGAGALGCFQACAPAASATLFTLEHPALLQVSDDRALAGSRRVLLQKAGFLVQTTSINEAEVNRFPDNLHVLLLCQTVRADQAFALLERLRSVKANSITVRVTRPGELATGSYDLVLYAPISPSVLMSEVGKLRGLTQGKDRVRPFQKGDSVVAGPESGPAARLHSEP